MSIQDHDHCVVCEHCGAHENPELHDGGRCPTCYGKLCRACDDRDAEPCPDARSMTWGPMPGWRLP